MKFSIQQTIQKVKLFNVDVAYCINDKIIKKKHILQLARLLLIFGKLLQFAAIFNKLKKE